MAAQLRRVNRTLGQMQKNLECAICLDLLQDPVSTKCDHQFCNFCILALLDKSRKSSAACPLCKESVTKRSLTSNDRLNEIVQAVRGVVQAVEVDSGFRCTPPKGPTQLSQQSKASGSPGSTTKASTKNTKAKQASKKGNLRQSKPRATGSIPIFVDANDSDSSDASGGVTLLITDFDRSHQAERPTRKSNRRKPLQTANWDSTNQPSKSLKDSSSSNKSIRSSEPPNDKPKVRDNPMHNSSHLLQALDEGSLGVMDDGSVHQREVLAGEKEPKDHLGDETSNQKGCLLEAFDLESLGMLGNTAPDGATQEKTREDRTLRTDHSKASPEPDNTENDECTLESDIEEADAILINGRATGDDINRQSPSDAKLQSEDCQTNVIFKDSRLLSGQHHAPRKETSQSSTDENLEDDPYEFISSQRTPRKPKLKRGRRQKNPSGKTSKEFDYMKWKKAGNLDKKLLTASQTISSQSPLTQMPLSSSKTVDRSPDGEKDLSFKKPAAKDAKVPDNGKKASPTQKATITDLGDSTECNSVHHDKELSNHQRITRSKQKKQDTSKKENIITQPGKTIPTQEVSPVSQNMKPASDCLTSPDATIKSTTEQPSRPNTQGRKKKTQNSHQPTDDMAEELTKPLEDPPTRRLRSRAKTQSTNNEATEVHPNEGHLKQPIEMTLEGGNPYDARCREMDPEEAEDHVILEEDVADVPLEETASISDQDDEWAYSDGEDISVSQSDLSLEPSIGIVKPIPELFQEQEANPERRPSRHTKLHLVNTSSHRRPDTHETAPCHEDEEEEPEIMGCSQPVVKKHSPLANAGVFGQVYKRGSSRLSKSPKEGDIDKPRREDMIGIDEKVEKMFQLEDEVGCNLENDALESDSNETGVNSNHLTYPNQSDSGTPIESNSQGAVSQPDLFCTNSNDVNVVDLTEESDAEDSIDEGRHLQSGHTDQVIDPPPCNGLRLEETRRSEKPPLDATATKSDWELALELAREFDTEPRQFSLRSSRHGKLDPAPKDDTLHPSRAKPVLDVSIKNRRSMETEGGTIKMLPVQKDLAEETSEIKTDGHAFKEVPSHHRKSKDHTITAGRKILRQPQRPASSEVAKERVPNPKDKRSRRIRRPSGLPARHDRVNFEAECGGMIESYDSGVDHKTENAQLVLGTATTPVSKTNDDHVSKRVTSQNMAKDKHQESQSTPLSTPVQRENESLNRDSSSRRRKLRSSSKNREEVLTPRQEDSMPNAKSHQAMHIEDASPTTKARPSSALPQTNASIGHKSGLSPDDASQVSARSSPLFSEDLNDEQQQTTEHSADHSDDLMQCQTPDTTTEQTGREVNKLRSPDSNESDKTESLDLEELEYEEEQNETKTHAKSVGGTPLSGSDTDSIELSEDEVEFVRPISAETNLDQERGLEEDQTMEEERTSIAQNGQQAKEETPSLKNRRQILTPESTVKGKTDAMGERHPREVDDDSEVSMKPFSGGSSNRRPKSKQDIRDTGLEEVDCRRSLRNTVPESILSDASQESTPRSSLSGGPSNKKATGRKSRSLQKGVPSSGPASEKMPTPKIGASLRRSQDASQDPASFKSSRDSSLIQESEKMLVPPPAHYQKTFMEKSDERGTFKSQKSPHDETQLSSKRKSCPVERNSPDSKPSSKRHRSAGAKISEIKHWEMGSERRSKRLRRNVSPCEQDEADKILSTENTGNISFVSVVMETEDSIPSSIQMRRKTRGLSLSGSHTKSQKSPPNIEAATGPRAMSSRKALSPPKCQEKTDEGMETAGLNMQQESHPLLEDSIDVDPSKKLPQSQELRQLKNSSPSVEALDRTGSCELFAGGSSSLFSTQTLRSASSSAKSPRGAQGLSLRQKNKKRASQKSSTCSLPSDLSPDGITNGSTQSLFTWSSSEHSRKEHSGVLSGPANSSLKSSGHTSRASLSIPFQGKLPQKLDRNEDIGETTKPVAAISRPKVCSPSKPLAEDFVPASEGASVSPDCLSGPIILPLKHLQDSRKDSGSPQETSAVKESLENSSQEKTEGRKTPRKSRFSFRRSNSRNRPPDSNCSSPRELNEGVSLRSSGNSSTSTSDSKKATSMMQTQEVDNSREGLSLEASGTIVSSLSSIQNFKPRKRKSSSFTTGKAKQSRVSNENEDQHKERRSLTDATQGDDFIKQSGPDVLEKFEKGRTCQSLGKDKESTLTDNEEEIGSRQHRLDVAEEKPTNRNPIEENSSGDVEMVSAEDDEAHGHDDEKDAKEDDEFNELSEDESLDDDDEDDMIIPPTPPCPMVTKRQSRKQPAFLSRSALSVSSSHSICPPKSLANRNPDKDRQAKGSCVQKDVHGSGRTFGGNRKVCPNLSKGDSSQSLRPGFEETAKKTDDVQDSSDGEMMDNSFAKRSFPLSSSPVKDGTCEDVKEIEEKAGGTLETQNTQSLSIFQMVDAEDHLTKTFSGSLKERQDKEIKDTSRDKPKVLKEEGMNEESGEVKESGNVESGLLQGEAQDREGERILVGSEKHYDTEDSTCSESHQLNLTSASSILSSQSELMNTQQRVKAQESLKNMALEIAQMEAALADGTDTQREPDGTPVKHPDASQERQPDTSQDQQAEIDWDPTTSSHIKNSDHGNDLLDRNSPADPCPASDDLYTPADLCTPADLFTPADDDPCLSDVEPADVCSGGVISDSHTDVSQGRDSSKPLRSNKGQRPAHPYPKRSRPVISDDESDSEEEIGDDVNEGMSPLRSGRNVDDDSLHFDSLPRNRLEIPGVTTYGSDSDMSNEEEELNLSLGSPRSPSPPPAPRSPSPPPDNTPSSAKRSSLLARLPESVEAVSRLAAEIRSRRSPVHPSPSKSKKGVSKRLTDPPRKHRVSDSESSDEDCLASSPARPVKRRNGDNNSRSFPGRDSNPGQARSGWKSKSLQMQSIPNLRNQNGRKETVTPRSSKSPTKNTPVNKSKPPNKAVLNTTMESFHSKPRDDHFSKDGIKESAEKRPLSRRDENENRETTRSDRPISRSGTDRDASPEERAPSPVIGRSLLTTPASKKKKKETKTLSFVTTGLNRTDMRDVDRLTKRFGCRFASTFNACTTHVIVNTDDDLVCERTLKYFQGIASRVWVVSFKWVLACLKTDELLPEEPFEVLGDVVNGLSHNGPSRARLCHGPYPLHKYDVCCVGPFTGLTKEQLVSLLELMGASTVQHPSLFPYGAGRNPLIVAQAEATSSQYDYDALYKKYRVPVISREWVLDIIATYKLQPMTDYLLSPCDNERPIVDLESDEN